MASSTKLRNAGNNGSTTIVTYISKHTVNKDILKSIDAHFKYKVQNEAAGGRLAVKTIKEISGAKDESKRISDLIAFSSENDTYLVGLALSNMTKNPKAGGLVVSTISNMDDAQLFFNKILETSNGFSELISGNRAYPVAARDSKGALVEQLKSTLISDAGFQDPFASKYNDEILHALELFGSSQISSSVAMEKIVRINSDYGINGATGNAIGNAFTRYENSFLMDMSKIPGVHVLVGFETNPNDLAVMRSASFQISIGYSLAYAALEKFKPAAGSVTNA